MGTTLLVIALIIEAAFAAYCIFTQSNQERLRSYVRIGVFAVFVLLTLLSVIRWSFRWYALALLLLVWAALGAWALIRKKEEQKEFKSWRIALKAFGMLLLLFIALIPALIFPQVRMPQVTGSYHVATFKDTYTDESRIETFTNTGEKRKVNIECWYPRDAQGTYPLVVFSHGSLGIKTGNTSTFIELTSNGYVACSIDHPYHSLFTIGTDGRLVREDPAMIDGAIGINNGKYSEAEIFKLHQEWMKLRTGDINFVLDTILARAKDSSSGAVYQRIDPQKIGLIGHSLGGESVALVARQRNDIGAVIDLDADLSGEYLDYVNGKNTVNDKVYPVPILIVFSDAMVRLLDAVKDPEVVIAARQVVATAPNAFEVHLAGTNHMSLTDLSYISPFFVSLINAAVPKSGEAQGEPTATLEKMNSMVLSFFDVYLKNKGTFTYKGTY